MKWLAIILVIFLVGCVDSLVQSPPYNGELDYESHKVALFTDVEFGNIQGNIIKVQISNITSTHFTLKYPIEQYKDVSVLVTDTELKLVMYNKYRITFEYHKRGNAEIFLKLKHYEKL